MAEKFDVLVVGGGPAGIITALTARKYYKEKKIGLLRSVDKGAIPCGIPYMISSLKNPDENIMNIGALAANNISSYVEKAIKIDRKAKVVTTEKGTQFAYEKLVIATGSNPIIPPVKGADMKGVYPVYKDMEYLKKAVAEIKAAGNVVVLGGGFIGVEFADELSRVAGVKTTLVEMLPQILANSFDPEFSKMAGEKLSATGVMVITGVRVEEITGNGKAEKVKLSDGRVLDAGAVILGIGATPEISMAKETGIEVVERRGICVDEYMRSSDPDVFAVGDCACKKDFYTRRDVPVMLASTATAEARIAGANLFSLKVVRENKGTIAIYSTYINGLVLGSAGLTETTAKKEGFEIITSTVSGKDRHPGTLPGGSDVSVKLVFAKQSGIILGGQVSGGQSAGELINLIGVAIQKRMSVSEIETLQMATQPYLTSAPTVYPLVVAAQNASNKF
jgi:NADH oxidase (H2O2-forming)